MSRRKEVLHRPACDSRPANQTFMEMLDSNRQEYEARMALAKENTILKARIAELEAVAEAAVVVHEQGPLGNFSEWEVLGDALRASGYLNE